MQNKIKIIFMGTSDFGAIILEGLINSGLKPDLVVTTTDKPVGRKQIITSPLTKIIAGKHNISVLQPINLNSSFILKISEIKPELIIVADYGKIIPKKLLKIPQYGCLNVHPSLLPKYRGPSPIQTTILKGDKKTGVTIILMDEEIDHGPIMSVKEIEINKKITYLELHNKLAKLGVKLLVNTISEWINEEIKPIDQSESEATYTKFFKKEDGKINWNNSAEEIERQIRALSPWPGAFTKIKINNKELKIKILKADSLLGNKKKIGEIFLTEEKELAIQTKEGILLIKELQIQGKNKITAKEFINGYKNLINKILY